MLNFLYVVLCLFCSCLLSQFLRFPLLFVLRLCVLNGSVNCEFSLQIGSVSVERRKYGVEKFITLNDFGL